MPDVVSAVYNAVGGCITCRRKLSRIDAYSLLVLLCVESPWLFKERVKRVVKTALGLRVVWGQSRAVRCAGQCPRYKH